MAFGCFKLAVVLEGIHARFLQRKTVGEGFEREGVAVPSLIQRAHRLLDGWMRRADRRGSPGKAGRRLAAVRVPENGNEARHPALAGPHVPSPSQWPGECSHQADPAGEALSRPDAPLSSGLT